MLSTWRLTLEAQLALHRAHAEGRINDEAIKSTFRALDVNGDGRVTYSEFMQRAAPVFFRHLIDSATMSAMLEDLAAQAAAEEGASGGSAAPPVAKLMSFEALDRAEREAKAASAAIVASRQRLAAHEQRARAKRPAPARAKRPSNVTHDVAEGIGHLIRDRHALQAKLASEVQADRAVVQVEFELSAQAVEGSEDERVIGQRTARMWTLLSKQMIAGLGTPRESQLGAIFDKYADPKTRCLSKGDLSIAIRDYSAARCDEIVQVELKELEEADRSAEGNAFVKLLTHARRISKEAELALYQAQAAGTISRAGIDAAFKALDVDGDGRVRRNEFVARAIDVFFSMQLGRIQNWDRLEEAAVALQAS